MMFELDEIDSDGDISIFKDTTRFTCMKAMDDLALPKLSFRGMVQHKRNGHKSVEIFQSILAVFCLIWIYYKDSQ